MTDETPVLTDILREGVARMLDVIVPGTSKLPSGRSVEAHGALLDRVLAADPGLAPLVVVAAERAAQSESCTLDDISTWVGDDIERLVFALHAAYYMSSTVRAALEYPGQRRLPVSEATPDQIGSDALIAPVINRGPIYVPTPD